MEYSPGKGEETALAPPPRPPPPRICVRSLAKPRMLTVRDRAGTRFVGSVRPVKSDYETRRRRDSEGRARTPDRGPGSPRRVAAGESRHGGGRRRRSRVINRRVAKLHSECRGPFP